MLAKFEKVNVFKFPWCLLFDLLCMKERKLTAVVEVKLLTDDQNQRELFICLLERQNEAPV